MDIRKIKSLVIKGLDRLNDRRYGKTYTSWMKSLGIPNAPVAGEKEWAEKWSQLGYKPNPVYYRLFSRYIGNDVNILPTDICHNIIELILDPFRFHGYYGDKNMFDKVLPQDFFPKTILRRMYGFYYDTGYKRIILNDNSLLELLKNATGGG